MEELQSTGDNEKKIQVIFIIILVAISVSAVICFTLLFESNESEDQGPTGPALTMTYNAISPSYVYNLTSSGENLVMIVDVRSCKCNYDAGHLPNATWNINPQSFYNTTNDLLIYDNTGAKSIEFCEQLVNHTYGAIYYLEGGINAWQNAGYEVV